MQSDCSDQSGVGKTTTAVNLGVSLVQQGKKVLLIDADAQANLTMALGYNRPDDIPITLSTVMQNIIDDKSFDVSQGIIHHSEGVDLLPSNIELSGFEVRLINAMSRERVLKTYVNEVKKNYDYVLIDCMPSLGMITINALAYRLYALSRYDNDKCSGSGRQRDYPNTAALPFSERFGAVASLCVNGKTTNQSQAADRRYFNDYGNAPYQHF